MLKLIMLEIIIGGSLNLQIFRCVLSLLGQWNFRRLILRCAVLAVVLPTAWLLGDTSTRLFLASQHTGSPAKTAEVQAPPKVVLTPAQVEFWSYLEQFNRLPENPTEDMVAVYNTKGIAPEFHYLKASKTSVLGNIKGLTAHRKLFVKRYPWVQPLLDHYAIEVPISTERFSGTAEEIGEKYEKLMMISRKCEDTPANEKIFVTNYLEGLLVVDFIYTSGSTTDKQQAMDVIDGVFTANTLLDPFRKKLEASFMTPASRDIGWAAIADYPELIKANTPATISQGFFSYSPADKVNFGKWMLHINSVRKADNKNLNKICRSLIHNEQVNIGLFSYSIYSAHSHELGRPAEAPWLIVIQILFKRLYPKDHSARYKQYLSKLDAAYPKIKS
jgi:hypothetical protein